LADEQLLVPVEMYLQAGVHIGTKYRTGFMKKYIYKIRPDGLSVLDISKIDKKIRAAAKLLANYEPEKILVVCRRENGRKAVKAFAKATGAKAIPGRYLPGTMTNPSFPEYFEPEILIVSDPWLDKQAVRDAVKSGVPIIGICDTNNTTVNIDLVIPGNNKSGKSLGLIYYILAREYLRKRGVIQPTADLDIPLKDF